MFGCHGGRDEGWKTLSMEHCFFRFCKNSRKKMANPFQILLLWGYKIDIISDHQLLPCPWARQKSWNFHPSLSLNKASLGQNRDKNKATAWTIEISPSTRWVLLGRIPAHMSHFWASLLCVTILDIILTSYAYVLSLLRARLQPPHDAQHSTRAAAGPEQVPQHFDLFHYSYPSCSKFLTCT